MKFSSPERYSIYSELKNLDLSEKRGDKSIKDFIEKLYKENQTDILLSLHNFADPENNFLAKHNYLDWNGQGDPFSEFYLNYNFDKETMEKGESVTNSHIQIDTNFVKKYAKTFIELQEEIKEIENGISNANNINQKIASFYKDRTELDAQDVFTFHCNLWNDAAEQLFLEEDHVAYAVETNFISCSDQYEPLTDGEKDEINEKVVKRISELQKRKRKPDDMPLFDLQKHKEMEKILEDSRLHMKDRVDGKNIAMFAGDKTDLLKERLGEVNLQLSEPIKNPMTKVWHYTISNSSSFRGLVYRDFLKYVNEMFDEIGKLPRCNYCERIVVPTSQQLRHLKNENDIYCQTGDCSEKGRILKQNEKRRGKKKQHDEKSKAKIKKNNLMVSKLSNEKILDLSSFKINKHLNKEKDLSIEEQSHIIQQKINQTIKKGG